jgi:plastocyanin
MDASTVTRNPPTRNSALPQWERVVFTLLASLVVLACENAPDRFGTALDTHHFYATLTFTEHAINMATDAPYDTLHIHVQAVMQDGSPVPGTVIYSTKDTTKIRISSTGLLTAIAPTDKAVILASLTYNGVTRTDSAVVSVVDGPPTFLETLSLQPAPGDSAKCSVQPCSATLTKNLELIRHDSEGNDIPALAVTVWSSDTLLAKITQSESQAVVTPVAPGRVMLHVATNAYGVVKQDSLSFVVGWPLVMFASTYARTQTGTRNTLLYFFPDTITVGVGGCVMWQNSDSIHTVDVTFDNPSAAAAPTGAFGYCDFYGGAHPGEGNITAWHEEPGEYFSGFAGRSFPQPGRYPFHSEVNGTSGVVIVCDELHDSSCFPW